MIKYHGDVSIDGKLIEVADGIKLLNYKTTTPVRFRKNVLTEDIASNVMLELAKLIDVDIGRLDYVYFSVCKGAEPHVDVLDPEVFHDTTYVVPVILPKGVSTIHAEDVSWDVHVGGVYQFNHEREHSMTLEDTESGCVVIMVAIKR
jgi:hypothetical protein